MKKFLIIVLMLCSLIMINCKNKETEKEFMEVITESKSYSLEGVMETYFMDSTKQSTFKACYKSPDLIKITLTKVNTDDSQVIIKNKDGVFVLVPSINKNFKIKSDWPNNGSYPYLLTSLAKDISNTENPIITEDEETKTIETKTSLYKDATVTKQKIVFNKETALPKEVIVYNNQGEMHIKVVFTKIELDTEIDDKEFVVNDSMETMRAVISDYTYEDRQIKYPKYVPDGFKLENEHTESNLEGSEVSSIMTYTGDSGFTIVQEYINDKETISFAQESGYLIHVMGIPTILKENGVQAFYEGVEYTIASSELSYDEMVKVLASYMIETEEK